MNDPLVQFNDSPLPLKRNFPVFRLMGGNLISFVGDQMYLLALPLLVLEITGSPISMGLVAALERLPLLAQPFMGVFTDYLNRKKILIACDLGRFLLLIGTALLYFFSHLTMIELSCTAFFIGVFSQIYNTCQFASVPKLVRKEDLQLVNSINSSLFNTAVFTAPAAGGMVISLLNPGAALFINGLSFLAALGAVVSLPLPLSREEGSGRAFMKDVKAGFEYVWSIKPILFTNAAMFFSVFGTTLFLTMLVFHLKQVIRLDAVQIGWLLSAGGLAAILGSIASSFVRKHLTYRSILFAGSMIGGGSIVLFGYADSYVWLLAGNAIGTFAASIQSPCILTIRQKLTPDRLLGRVQATSRFLTWFTMPFAAFLAGILADSFGTGRTILTAGVIVILSSFFYLHRSLGNKALL